MKIPGGFDALFRQLTPLFLLGVLAAIVFEPWVPGGVWLRERFGETAVLRACTAALGLYVLLLWGESLRLHALLTGLLQAFRDFRGDRAPDASRNPKARLEAARLLIAALASADPEVRASSHHNLQRLAGVDLGPAVGPWQQWLAEQERATGA